MTKPTARLFAWVGNTDYRGRGESGPIVTALRSGRFTHAHLIADVREKPSVSNDDIGRFRSVVETWEDVELTLRSVELNDPTDFTAIYRHACETVDGVLAIDPGADLTFHTSPGTPQMGATWLVLGQTKYRASLIQTAAERPGDVRQVQLPFTLRADVLPSVFSDASRSINAAISAPLDAVPGFERVLHESRVMRQLLEDARRAAAYQLRVLIQGPTGSGKELVARGIHIASGRAGAFVAVNCGAFSPELITSELFGHVRGAFTGATGTRAGVFASARGGTIFLDEVGELPPDAQKRLLRVLEDGTFSPVGSDKQLKSDAAVVAATHRTLHDEVRAGTFREDLYYRLAHETLFVPPLSERPEDIAAIARAALGEANREFASIHGYVPKTLSAGALAALRAATWPGNVRELRSFVLRLAYRLDDADIGADSVGRALAAARPSVDPKEILGRPIGSGFNVRKVTAEVQRHYLDRALAMSHGNQAAAADLLGLKSGQVISQWMSRLRVQVPLAARRRRRPLRDPKRAG